MKNVETIADLGYRRVYNPRVEVDELINDQIGESFFLYNRSFSEINWSFRDLPKKLIAEYIRQLDRPVRILDIGGGEHSHAANDIAEMFGDKVYVVNVDLVANDEGKNPNVSPVQANMFFLPLKDQSFDLVTSFQTIPHLTKDSERVPKVISEISRVLTDGGTALLHEDYYSYPEYFDSTLPADGFGTKITIKDRALNLNFRRRLERISYPELTPPGRFMVMQKGEQLPSIKRIIKSVPDKLSRWRTR